MEGLKIRGIKSSDCGSIMKLIKELANYMAEDGESKVKTSVKDLDRLGFNDKYGAPSFMGVVAELHEDKEEAAAAAAKSSQLAKKVSIIGVALYHLKYSTWEGPVMHVNTFIVSEKYRRQGVGSKLLVNLAKTAQDKKYTRISCEIPRNNETASKFFMKHGAINLTKEEAWLNYDINSEAVKKMLTTKHCMENIRVRPTEPKDCVQIKDMIQELAEFEKMPDGPKLSVRDLQRDGFYKLFPDYYSYVAELENSEENGGEVEIIGYSISFLTFHPILGKRMHMEDLYVTPKHRGKRVGEMLFQAVAQFVDADGYQGFTLEVLEWNTKAIQFYDKFGGTNVSLGEKGQESFRIKKDAIASLASS